jgi:hypothetical protein
LSDDILQAVLSGNSANLAAALTATAEANAATAQRYREAVTPAPSLPFAEASSLKAEAERNAQAARDYRLVAIATPAPIGAKRGRPLLAAFRKYARSAAKTAQNYRKRYPLPEEPKTAAAASAPSKSVRPVKVTKVAAKPARISRARAVHSHASHGGSRAATGGEDGSSGKFER